MVSFLSSSGYRKDSQGLLYKRQQENSSVYSKLDVLVEKTGLKVSDEEMEFLKKVNEFNIETRYPDRKFSFYKLCNKAFTEKYFSRIKEFHKWLLKEIK